MYINLIIFFIFTYSFIIFCFYYVKKDSIHIDSKIYVYMTLFLFLNVINFKLNKILFNIPFYYIFIINLILVVICKTIFLQLAESIKNLFLFNWLLYHFLVIKNKFFNYGFIILEELNKCSKFQSNLFILSIIMLIIFYGFHGLLFLLSFWPSFFSIFLSCFLLIYNILNFIESKFIFNNQNISSNRIQNLDFKKVQNILFINKTKFNRNIKLNHIEKRYISGTQIRQNLKEWFKITTAGTSTAVILTTVFAGANVISHQKQAEAAQKQAEVAERNVEIKAKVSEKKINLNIFEKLNNQKNDNNKQIEFRRIQLNEHQNKIEKAGYFNQIDSTYHRNQIAKLDSEIDELLQEQKTLNKNQQAVQQKLIEEPENFLDSID